MATVVVRGNASRFAQRITTDAHRLAADEPATHGGTDADPSPYEFLLAAPGA